MRRNPPFRQVAQRDAEPVPRVYVSFLPPYNACSDVCTAVRMIRAGLVDEAPITMMSGVLLNPSAEEPLSAADLPVARKGGLHLIDGPWHALGTQVLEFRNRDLPVRCLPSCLEPSNEYYRRNEPKYFFAKERFSTAEAAAYGLGVLGCLAHGREFAAKMGFEAAYVVNMAGYFATLLPTP